MFTIQRANAWKAGLGVLGASCLAVVVVAGASATATTRASGTGYPKVDHQLCYSASGIFGKVPPPGKVRLIDRFNPNGFLPVINHKAVLHCNPVIKVLPTGQVFTRANPNAHLVWFPITEQDTQPLPWKTVGAQNQFGKGYMTPGPQPTFVGVPSWKGTADPPAKKLSTPPGLNHFTCYPVKMVSGSYQPPAGLMLRDQFAKVKVRVAVNSKPEVLCLPAEKVVRTATGSKDYPQVNPDMQLLCFGVSKTPFHTPVWDQNQFGTAKMKIMPAKWLCLPSTLSVIVGQGAVH
jgi:hypothetical protein